VEGGERGKGGARKEDSEEREESGG